MTSDPDDSQDDRPARNDESTLRNGHEPAPGTKKSNLVMAGSAVVLVTVIGLVAFLLVVRGFTATGTLTLFDRDGRGVSGGAEFGVIGKGASCFGTGAYDDIREGAAVVLRDESGTAVGEGQLEYTKTIGRLSCIFSFTIETVSSGADLYEVEVSGRDGTTYSKAELQEGVALVVIGEW